jgi:hypothetical protein
MAKDPNIILLKNGLPVDLFTEAGQIGAIRIKINNIEQIPNPTDKARMEYVRIWMLRSVLNYLVDFSQFKVCEWKKSVLKNDIEKSRLSIGLSGHAKSLHRFDHIPYTISCKIYPEDLADVLCEMLNKASLEFKIRRPCIGDKSYYFIIETSSPITEKHVIELIKMHKKKYGTSI